MTGISDTAALAAIGAAARELKLPPSAPTPPGSPRSPSANGRPTWPTSRSS